MADTPDERTDDQPLSERFLDLFVFLPTGLAVTLAEELPRLAERGRERLGVQVNSARAVGKFAVTAGGHELKRRSEGLKRPSTPSGRSDGPSAPTVRTGQGPSANPAPPRLRAIPRPPAAVPASGTTPQASAAAPRTSTAAPVRPAPAEPTAPVAAPAPSRPSGGHVPEVASLAIPGFDTLSASQVVQRLDGLSRSELVAVRAYETSTRGRRTILSRVDQLLDERS